MANGMCRMHGGASAGPRTAAGLARSRRARWKHGLYSAEALAEQKRERELLIQSREFLKRMERNGSSWCMGFIQRFCPRLLAERKLERPSREGNQAK
jgi:hypothetical protein